MDAYWHTGRRCSVSQSVTSRWKGALSEQRILGRLDARGTSSTEHHVPPTSIFIDGLTNTQDD